MVTEQAVDAGPNFKLMKKEVKTMDNHHLSLNPVLLRLQQVLGQLENNDSEQVVKLQSHKKKAILATVPNLPAATGMSHSVIYVCKGFMCNSQLDAETTSIPLFQNLLHIHPVNIKGTCLENRRMLMDTFFERMYFSGTIEESMFDKYDIPKDTNSKGEAVVKSNIISIENCHRAKVLTLSMQVAERRRLIDSKRMKEYNVNKSHYKSEVEDVSLNESCEGKFVQMVLKACPNLFPPSCDVDYESVQGHLTVQLIEDSITCVYKDDLRAFVRVRSHRSVRRGKVCYLNVPATKSDLVEQCIQLKDMAYLTCLYPDCPVLHQLLENNDDN